MPPPENHLSEAELQARLLRWALSTSRYPLFKGSSEAIGAWFLLVERACQASGVPNTQRSEAAILLIVDTEEFPLQSIMRARHEAFLEKSQEKYWPWVEFKKDIFKIVTESQRPGWNWRKAAGIALMVGGAAVAVAAGGLLLVHLVGFGTAGVGAGSLAAFLQSVFYGGATGGIFSFFQMLGATTTVTAIQTLLAAGIFANRAGRGLGR